jgi:crotonobetainyl-CoA:carnitine CoA-transferase CaiB-like acyl-CoA transferase
MALQTLSGIRVLDLTAYVAGPYGATLLGDLGADVLKIEGPGGDTMRHYPSTLPGESRVYLGANRNKRSIVMDLKQPRAQEVLHRMVATSDVLIHNFRPAAAGRLRVDRETLHTVNPQLVYCSLTGFGMSGPMADAPGFDQVLQCMTGIAHAQGAPTGAPQVVLGSVVDYYGAALLAMAVSAALFDRGRTGQGQCVDASLLRSALTMQAGRMVWARDESRDVERDLRAGRLAGIHPTREGYLYLQAQTPKFWTALCELTGMHDLATDPRYDDMRKRKDREDEIVPRLRAALATRTALEWEAVFGEAVPCTAVRCIEDVFDHPQVLAQGLVAEHDHPQLGSYRAMTGPVAIDGGRPAGADRRAPMLGEHTDELLAEFGLGSADIEALRACGAVQ